MKTLPEKHSATVGGDAPAKPDLRAQDRHAAWRRGADRSRRWILGATGIALFFVFLQTVSLVTGLSEQTLPRATTILSSLVGLAGDSEFLFAVGQTLSAALAGLAIAVALAIPIGVILGTFRVTYDATSALIEFIRPVPAPALIPLVLLIFGATAQMKISLVAFAAFWILLFNTIYAVRDVDPVLKDNARSFGYGPVAVLAYISLPSAAPFIYTGLRLAATAAFLVAISAELLAGGSGGIGEWLRLQQESGFHADLVYAGAFFAGVVGLLLNLALSVGERILFPWNIATRTAQ